METMGTGLDIVVISLASATKRRQQIDAMFAGWGRSWTFFDAHTSLQQSGLIYDPERIMRSYGRPLTVPQIAVTSSHIAVLSEFVARNAAEHILVLEDDVIFDTDFPLDKLRDFCVTQGIDYIRLFGKHYADAVRLGFFYDRSILRYTTSTTGCQAYIMSRRGAKRFIESFPEIDTTVDLAMDAFWQTDLPIYSIFPYPVIERYSPTSIPIPPIASTLGPGGLAYLYAGRLGRKIRKIIRNWTLRPIDKTMQGKFDHFSQVMDVDKN
jgi:glycosyl transferase, family 25